VDPLDRLAGPVRDLLGRVDGALMATGAPADHPIWALLRRVGALPGEAVAAVADLRPEPLVQAAADLRVIADEYAAVRVGEPDGWTGPAAEAYAARWRDLARHLGGEGPDSMAGRLAATAEYLAETAGWIAVARRELARALAAALGSAEALRLRTAADAVAAAAIGARVLAAVAQAQDRGWTLADRWAGRLDELPYRPSTVDAARVAGTTTVAT
jgi:hypothetical protein